MEKTAVGPRECKDTTAMLATASAGEGEEELEKLKARELHRTHTCTPFNKIGAWTCSLWRPSEGCWLQGFPPHCTCFVTIILCAKYYITLIKLARPDIQNTCSQCNMP